MRCGLKDIIDKVAAGERLSFDDGVQLYESKDILTLGEMADRVRRRLHGRVAYFNVNRHINYSNYCVLRCKFCSFYVPYAKTSDERTQPSAGSDLAVLQGGTPQPVKQGYELTVEEIVDRATEAYEQGATEVHIVGGLHPKLPFSYYTDMCRAIRRACPKMHTKAFTAIEIIHFTRIARGRKTIAEVLGELREAGLGSLPGGGAEIFDDRVHDEAFKNKVGETEWFEVHRVAHEMGIFTNATMLYGHVETRAERVKHLIKLRDHQDASLASRRAHFNCVVPLSFVPQGSELAHLPGPTGLEDLRALAISRLMLDNVAHVKAFWIMQTPKLAQVSLNWGVDDIDGTVVYYDITTCGTGFPAGQTTGWKARPTHQELSVDRLRRLIREAGCVPVERDTLYRRVVREKGRWRVCDAAPGAVAGPRR